MARPNQRDRICAYIEEAYARNGYSPSISDIAAHLSLSAKSNIHRQLQQLVREGFLQNRGGQYVPAKSAAAEGAVLVPLLGRVAAGQPITAIEELEGYVAYLPRFGDGRRLFALRVKGDSMVEVGINSGDIVVVEETPEVADGEIAVALIGEEATVKTFYREDGHIRLQPENRTMAPILVKNVAVLGRVVSSMRYY